MKTNLVRKKQNKGFTLIEMIGVLAVIAILAALLIPKVFQAINEARINTVPVGTSSCKTAVIDHYAKQGGLNLSAAGVALVIPAGGYLNYDETVLMVAGFQDKPFAPRVGTAPDVILDVIGAVAAGAAVTGAEGTAYCLSGQTAAGVALAVDAGINDVTGSHVVFARITGVPIADAQAISTRIDGAALSTAEGVTTADLVGRVKYATAVNGVTTVYTYLTHR